VSDFDGSELEFWLGAWDASWGEHGQGTNRLDRILGGHVIHERFEGHGQSGQLHGESWSVYDPTRHLWRQTWVDDTGGYLDLVGGQTDGWFTFERAAPEDGPDARQRMVFRDVTDDAFNWTWEASADGGATWETRWRIVYRRATAPATD
jgi:hypothetical protein